MKNFYCEPQKKSDIDNRLLEECIDFIDSTNNELIIEDDSMSQEYVIPLIINNLRVHTWPTKPSYSDNGNKPFLIFPSRGKRGSYVSKIGKCGLSSDYLIDRKNVESITEVLKKEREEEKMGAYGGRKNSIPKKNMYTVKDNFEIDREHIYDCGLLFIDTDTWNIDEPKEAGLDPSYGVIKYSHNIKNPDISIDRRYLSFSRDLRDDNLSKKAKLVKCNTEWTINVIPSDDISSKLDDINSYLDDIGDNYIQRRCRQLIGITYNIIDQPIDIKSWNNVIKTNHPYFENAESIMDQFDEVIKISDRAHIKNKILQIKRKVDDLLQIKRKDAKAEKRMLEDTLGSGESARFVVKSDMHKKALKNSIAKRYSSSNFSIVKKHNLDSDRSTTTIFTYLPETDSNNLKYPKSTNNKIFCYNLRSSKIRKLSKLPTINMSETQFRSISFESDLSNFSSNSGRNNSYDSRNLDSKKYKLTFQNGDEQSYESHRRVRSADETDNKIQIRDLEKGDEIIIPDSDGRDLDFYMSIISDDKIKQDYEFALNIVEEVWDKAIGDLKEDYESLVDLHSDIVDCGGKVDTAASVRRWFKDVHGPRDIETIEAVLSLSEKNEELSDTVHEKLNFLRKMNSRIGKKYNEIYYGEMNSSVMIEYSGIEFELDENSERFIKRTIKSVRKCDN